MKKISLKFLGEPVAKGRPKISSFGGFARAYTPKKTRMAEADIRAQLMPQLPEGWNAMEGPVSMTAIFYRTRPKSTSKRLNYPITKPDLDNLLKLLTDSLSGIIFKDDAQIILLTAWKQFGEPSIAVELEELETMSPKPDKKKR